MTKIPAGRTNGAAPLAILDTRDSELDPEALARQLLLSKLSDDRADLRRVANSVREIAQTVEAAQSTLAITSRTLRWLLLAGSAAAFALWLSDGRRPSSALMAGLSMQLLRRWLRPASRTVAPGSTRRLPAPRRPRVYVAHTRAS